jgi:hypothetical protein
MVKKKEVENLFNFQPILLCEIYDASQQCPGRDFGHVPSRFLVFPSPTGFP